MFTSVVQEIQVKIIFFFFQKGPWSLTKRKAERTHLGEGDGEMCWGNKGVRKGMGVLK